MTQMDWIDELIDDLEKFAQTTQDTSLLQSVYAAKAAYALDLDQTPQIETLPKRLGLITLSEP